jgi:transcriptional regulator with XRE-family HTH domain
MVNHGAHMTDLKAREIAAEGARLTRELCSRLGGELRRSRRRQRMSQSAVAELVGVSQAEISRLEAGRATRAPIEHLIRVALIFERRLTIDESRDPGEEPADAGHLIVQELVLRLARQAGHTGTFELATKPVEPWRSADVGIRDDPHRVLILTECWNFIGDIGAGARSTSRKVAEAEMLAVAVGGERPYRVASCWVIRATRRNRELVARYPESFASRFPGSSSGWVLALETGAEPPEKPGLVWTDVKATRLFPWRRRSASPSRYAVITERMISSSRSRTMRSATPAASISASASSR